MIELEVSGPQDYFLSSSKPFNLFMAGAGSGKTHTMGLLSVDYIRNFPHMVGFIGANTYEQLNKSTLKRIFEVWQKDFKWINGINFVVDKTPPKHFKQQAIKLKDYNNTITFDNGALVFTASLDNYRAIDGQEIGWGMLDETKDTDQEAIDEVIVWRLRQPGMWIDNEGELVTTPTEKGFNPLYIFTSPAKEQWINEMFGLDKHYDDIERRIFSKDDFFSLEQDDKCVVISSSFHNQANLPAGFIDQRINQYRGNKHLIDTYVYGSPIAKIGNEFYHQFNRSIHVKENLEPLPDVMFHVSSDQNTAPYYTLLASQITMEQDRWKVRFLSEYCYENPNNNMESVCQGFEKEYGDRCPGLFYYGDRSGLVKSTMRKASEHHYNVLEEVLKRYINSRSNRLLSVNPNVVQRRDFINGILAGAYNIDIEISTRCKNLIADMEFLKEDRDGNKLKKRVKDKSTGDTYEKYGHTSDAMDYLICSAFLEMFEEMHRKNRR
jgi:hypothetical protein